MSLRKQERGPYVQSNAQTKRPSDKIRFRMSAHRLEHRVVVLRCLRNRLDSVPMLDDLAALKAEYFADRQSALSRMDDHMHI
jgi:hypothetical protein